MKLAERILEQVTGNGIADALIGEMEACFADFAQARRQYLDVMAVLQQELGDKAKPSASNEMDAISQQAASSFVFSGFLGLKANLDNFINPVARDFLEVDPDTYLREETARRLPAYSQAQQLRDQFYAQLSEEQQGLYESVIDYVSYLETVGPKLAHYYGYILGNDLLPRLIPGYHLDMAQTAQYRMLLQQYMGKRLELL